MNNQQALVEQIIQNLSFEVEAVPKNKSLETARTSKSNPLNVKIRVRKNDEIHPQHDVSSVGDEPARAVQKIRLVNSDETIMTFDVFMEAEFEKKPSKNLRKHIFEMLKPGVPSSSYSANMTAPSKVIGTDGTLKQQFKLSKNTNKDYPHTNKRGEQKWLFGKCKPGGCLDPPFSEDKYSYKPNAEPEQMQALTVPKQEEINDETDAERDLKIKSSVRDEEVKSDGRHSSLFDSGIFKKKRKSSDKSTNTKSPDKTNSVLSIYKVESASKSASTRSNSIITYPPQISSDVKICEDKTVRSRGPSEDKSRKSFNDHSEPHFIPPKGVNREKDKDMLQQKDNTKRQPSEVADNDNVKKSYHIPPVIPIPIPLPFPFNKSKPKADATNDDTSTMPIDNTGIMKPNTTPDREWVNIIDEDDSATPPRDLPASGDTDENPQKISKMTATSPSNIEQPSTFDETGEKLIDKLVPKQEPDSEIDKNDINGTAQPNDNNGMLPSKALVPIPIPIDISDHNSAPATTSEETRAIIEQPIDKHLNFDPEKDETAINEIKKPIKQNSNEILPKNQKEEIDVNKTPSVQETLCSPSDRTLTSDKGSHKTIPIDLQEPSVSSSKTSTPTKDIRSDSNKILFENDLDTNLSNNKDEIRIPMHSDSQKGLDAETAEILPLDTEKDKFIELTKPSSHENLGGHAERKFTSERNMNIIAAPVFIEKAASSPNFDPAKENKNTNLLSEPIVTPHEYPTNPTGIPSKPIKIHENPETPSPAIPEVIGIKPATYGTDDNITSTPSVKQIVNTALSDKTTPEGIFKPPRLSNETNRVSGDLDAKLTSNNNVIPTLVPLPSTSTLKSAVKKDTIAVDLGFYSYLNDKNQRVFRTFDTANAPMRLPNDTVTIIKSQIKMANEIRIPVDSDHDISIQIKKLNSNHHVSISESGLDYDNVVKQKLPVQYCDDDVSRSEIKEDDNTNKCYPPDDNVRDLYEQELIPLQSIIKNLRDEIDFLAAQQIIFKDKIYCPNKPHVPRLHHSSKKCLGYMRK